MHACMHPSRDVSRVCHCVLGRTHSSFGRREYWTKGPIGRRKKIECLCKLQTPGKNSVIWYANLCFVKTIFTSWLTLHSLFPCRFSDKSRKATVFCYHFPQSLVPSLLCLSSHVLRDVIRVVFWWDNRRHCLSAKNNLPFQSILCLLHAFQKNFKL